VSELEASSLLAGSESADDPERVESTAVGPEFELEQAAASSVTAKSDADRTFQRERIPAPYCPLTRGHSRQRSIETRWEAGVILGASGTASTRFIGRRSIIGFGTGDHIDDLHDGIAHRPPCSLATAIAHGWHVGTMDDHELCIAGLTHR
jgi:hypothetical protein